MKLSIIRFGKVTLTPKLIIDKITSRNNIFKSFKRGKYFNPTLNYGEYEVLSAHKIPEHIIKPLYATSRDEDELRKYYSTETVYAEVKTETEIRLMRKAAKIAAQCLKLCVESTKIGVTAEDIDKLGHNFILESNAYPAGVNFHGFPKAICISVNEVACHGIPNLRPFREGDVVSYDCTVFADGVFGDCAATVPVGKVSDELKKLVKVSEECVYKAIDCLKPGTKFSTLAKVVTEHASNNGFTVIREFGGHFIGRMMHMPPMIQFHHPSYTPGCAEAGQIFTIEPIICQGDNAIYTWDDGWTIATVDNGFCSQFENTVLITDDGCEILTVP